MRFAVLFVVLAVVLIGCGKRENASGEATETIAPAEAQPAPTDSDAMTQTVNVDDRDRPPTEGGALTETSTTPTTPTTTTSTTDTSLPVTENPTTTTR